MIVYYLVTNVPEGRAWVQEHDTRFLWSPQNPGGDTWKDIAGCAFNTIEGEYDTLEEAEKAAAERNLQFDEWAGLRG
jgi:ribosomal protein S12